MELGTRERVGSAPLEASPYAVEPDRHELEGVPLLHLPMPGPGTFVTLTFGTGRADEPLHLSGIAHLSEHLVMDGVGTLALDGNGRTEPLRVSFAFHGRPDEASAFLRSVSGAIREPLLDRIEAEMSVLQTEEDGAGRGMGALLPWLRYGNAGLGTTFGPELILWGAAREVVGAWMGSHLVAGNAAV